MIRCCSMMRSLLVHTIDYNAYVLSTHIVPQRGEENMNPLSFALFSTFVVVASAAYYEPGPCPPKPPILAPFDVERVTIMIFPCCLKLQFVSSCK